MSKDIKINAALVLTLLGHIVFCYFTPRENFYQLIGLSSALFGLYWFLFKRSALIDFRLIIFSAIIFRLVYVFAIPNLSDDFYRFIWDGTLIKNGINPFLHIPEYYIKNGVKVPGLEKYLFDNMNSPKYFTIYPPIGQLLGVISSFLSPENLYGKVLVMKSILLACEIGTIYVIHKTLVKLRLNQTNVLLYALNPLVIFELVGNIHFEGLMLFFLSCAFYFMISQKNKMSSVFFALSICSKIIPLLLAPLIIRKLGLKKGMIYLVISGVITLVLFAPFLSLEFFKNFGASLDLYFQKFEFNASFYYLIRWIGFQVKGYNIIQTLGPVLSISTVILIGLFSFFVKKSSEWSRFFTIALISWFSYLLLSTIVHPWYATSLILFSVFSKSRFAILWSGLIMLSYWAYSNVDFSENYWLLFVEYFLVFVLIGVEVLKNRGVFISRI